MSVFSRENDVTKTLCESIHNIYEKKMPFVVTKSYINVTSQGAIVTSLTKQLTVKP